jgi:opacity protein-like surface antigen
MKRLLFCLGVAALFCAVSVAQQPSSNANQNANQSADQRQTSAASAQNSANGADQSTPQNANTASQSGVQSPPSSAQEQNNPAGGSPNSAVPGRVEGSDPTQVQDALNKELPKGAQVTASIADDGSLKLTGTVQTDTDKNKAEEIARKVSNRKINDQIQVNGGNSAEPK